MGFYPEPGPPRRTRSRAWSSPARVVARGRPGRPRGRRATRSWASSAVAPTPSGSPSTSASCCRCPPAVGAGRRRRHPRGVDHRVGRPRRAGRSHLGRYGAGARRGVGGRHRRHPDRQGRSAPSVVVTTSHGQGARPAASSAPTWSSTTRREDFVEAAWEATGGRGVDVVLDVIGGDYLDRNVDGAAHRRHHRAGRRDGRRSRPPFNLGRPAAQAGHAHRHRAAGPARSRRRSPSPSGSAREVLPLFDAGALRPVIDCRFPLDAIAEAHRHMESNANIGKILIDVARCESAAGSADRASASGSGPDRFGGLRRRAAGSRGRGKKRAQDRAPSERTGDHAGGVGDPGHTGVLVG